MEMLSVVQHGGVCVASTLKLSMTVALCKDQSSCSKIFFFFLRSGNNWFYFKILKKPWAHTIAWPFTTIVFFMHFICVCECGLVLEGAQWNVVHVVLELICQAAFPGRALLDLLKVYHPDIPRDKQAAKPPTARVSAPAGRGIVNIYSTILLLYVLSLLLSLSFFFLLLSLKARNVLISKVV